MTIVVASTGINSANADSIERLELADWDQLLNKEGWQVFLAPPDSSGLGQFVFEPKQHDVTDHEFEADIRSSKSLENCGVSLIQIKRTSFSSPHVPLEIEISRPDSILMSAALEAFFEKNQSVELISAIVEGPIWSRILTSDTTATLHSSASWADPNIRAAIIACVQENGKLVTEADVVSDVTFQFFNEKGFVIPISKLLIDTDRGSLFKGATMASQFHLRNFGVSWARRRGLCVNSAVFFTNPDGGVGNEDCS
ncbi:hypothetical protein [uncultured Litoreibacter sp.]|uniref:hypothetical protein n=1 Tax=uncultured Litoreibacter sp. TaxID=1392394 RepID=UPI002626455F|nr:hypothetical protein [uncultured Litoreibacter sp.]